MNAEIMSPSWVADRPHDRYVTPRARRTYQNREWFARQLERGKTQKEIARAAGVSAPTIFIWKCRHQLGASPSNGERGCLSDHARETYANRGWLVARLEEGKTFAEIALLAHISRSCIISWVRRHRLTRGGRLKITALKTYANRAWLTARIGEGITDREIAKQCGCSFQSIGLWRHRFGIPRVPRRNGPYPKAERLRRAFGEWLAPRLSELPITERDVLVLKATHGIGGAVRTHADVGRELDLTRARVQQIHHKALRKIVAAVGSDALKDFPDIAALPPFVTKGRKAEKGQAKLLAGDATYANRDWLAAQVGLGKTDRQIAREVGLKTSCSITRWRHQLGIATIHHPRSGGGYLSPLARETYADPSWLRMLVAAGLTDAKIAAQAGCQRTNITYWRNKFGIAPSYGLPAFRRTPT